MAWLDSGSGARHSSLGFGASRPPADPLWMIVTSLLVATVLTVYPIPYHWVNWRPMWLVAVALYWVLHQPAWCGIWFAFGVGVCADLLLDMPVGSQSLVLVLVVWGLRVFVQNRRVMTFSNGWLLAAASLLAFMLIHLMMQKLMGRQLSLSYWLSAISTLALWPAIYGILKKWRA